MSNLSAARQLFMKSQNRFRIFNSKLY